MPDHGPPPKAAESQVARASPLKAKGKAENPVAGMGMALQMVRELVGWPLRYGAEAQALGLEWPRGLLLHGPPGCGKTLLVHAVAQEFSAKLHYLSSSSVFGAYAGESERRLRETFAAAAEDAAKGLPAIVFIDEIDTLCPKRDARRQQEARVVAQLLTLMDGSAFKGKLARAGRVLVVAATNRPNALDPALRRPGRFDREVAISVPNKLERFDILQLHAAHLPLAPEVDVLAIASSCNGYSGADLAALCREAATLALGAELQDPSTKSGTSPASTVQLSHFQAAMQRVGPSIGRGAAVEVPAVTWTDVGGLHHVKKRLQQAVEWPLKHSAAFSRLGLSPPRGVLLHGPPGCSKTTLARAAAHAANATLFSLSGAELFSMFVGDGEALLRETFRKARLAAPSIVFFDEADALATRRGSDRSEGGGVSVAERLLSALLTEMDGLESAEGVLVLAATNHPRAIDAALMRPGRFDVVLYVPPPDEAGRLEALQVHTRGMAVAEDVDLKKLAASTECFTGAELAAICREAALTALREDINSSLVRQGHFDKARAGLKPGLTPFQIASYASFSTK